MVPRDQDWTLETDRLALAPMYVSDSEELFDLLCAPAMSRSVASLDDVRARIRHWESRQSPDGDEIWLNWTVRLKEEDAVVGRLQATVKADTAEMAWVVGHRYRSLGYASEASGCAARWLSSYFSLREIRANIHPGNKASQRVAEKIGLSRSGTFAEEGEEVWSGR